MEVAKSVVLGDSSHGVNGGAEAWTEMGDITQTIKSHSRRRSGCEEKPLEEKSGVIQIGEGAPGLKKPCPGTLSCSAWQLHSVSEPSGGRERAWPGSSDQPKQPDVLLMRNKRPCARRAETWSCVNI